uniref:Complexin n=1 Tax=Panagrellus redivivus TaxID=6233 RepID=A0A7E4W7C7_PANRE
MSFIVKHLVSNKLNNLVSNIGGGSKEEEEPTVEDPAAVLTQREAEERRREKHRAMELEREQMRANIRKKYNIPKKTEAPKLEKEAEEEEKKTPEQLVADINAENDNIVAQLGLTVPVEKAKTAMSSAVSTVRGYLPF